MLLERLYLKRKRESKFIRILIGGLFFLIASHSLARIPDVMSRVYDPYAKIDDYSFEIESPELLEMIKLKTNLPGKSELKMMAHFLKDRKGISILGNSDISDEIKNLIKEEISKKATFHWRIQLKDWLMGYKFEEQQDTWFVYIDETGLKDVAKIKIKFLDKSLKIVEKKPTGTLSTDYFYKIEPWSNEQLVLDHVERKMYEGTQSISTKSQIRYGKIEKVGYVPVEVVIDSVQQLSMGSSEKVARTIKEQYLFKNFQIQNNSAQQWFSKSP